MKVLIPIVIGLLVVGCGKKLTPEEQKALIDSVVGEYESKVGGNFKYVFLDNGTWEWHIDDESNNPFNNQSEYKWSIVDGEIHTTSADGSISMLRINQDKSINEIAILDKYGERIDLKGRIGREGDTFKKIK